MNAPRKIIYPFISCLWLIAPHTLLAKDTTTAEVGDAIQALRTSYTCNNLIALYHTIKTPENASASELVAFMALALYLEGFANGKGDEKDDVYVRFSEWCIANPEATLVEFPG